MPANPRVLIADDDEHIRKLLEGIIISSGCDIVGQAHDGNEAVSQFKSNKPDITLLDIDMPKMNGIEALGEIISIKPDAFVIMLTAQNSTDAVRQCITRGAKQYLLKEHSPEKLSEMIAGTIKQYIEKT